VSKRVADDLGQLARWSNYLHEIGQAEVKHGLRVDLFNLYTDELGNPEVPTKLLTAPSGISKGKKRTIAAAVAAVVLAGAIGLFALILSGRAGTTPPAAPPPLPEQSLTYSLTVQKMSQGKPVGGELEMTGHEVYGNGWKFRFNIQPEQPGALYLLNEGPGPTGATEYNILFPTPASGGVGQLAARQRVQTGWNYFVDTPGVEKLWIIWSKEPLSDLDAVFQSAVANKGVIANVAEILKVQSYLKRYESQRPEVVPDKAKEATFVKGRGDIVVTLLELTHKAY